jgi:hypothetical protein
VTAEKSPFAVGYFLLIFLLPFYLLLSLIIKTVCFFRRKGVFDQIKFLFYFLKYFDILKLKIKFKKNIKIIF